MSQYLSIALSSVGRRRQPMPPRPTGDTLPARTEWLLVEMVVVGLRGSSRSGEIFKAIQRCIRLGRMGSLAQGLFFHRTLPCSLTSLYLNSIETKIIIIKKLYSTQRTAFKTVQQLVWLGKCSVKPVLYGVLSKESSWIET